MMKKKIVSLLTAAALACGSAGIIPAQAEEYSRAAEIVAGMTLEQKISQMLMIQYRYWREDGSNGKSADVTVLNEPVAELLGKYSFGGVILFAENVKGTEQTARLTSQLQEAAAKNEQGIPLLIAADQEGGSVIRLGTGTNTCGNMALGATFDANCAYENASIIAEELSAVGINVDFAPVLDVNNDPENPIINIRSFSSDPGIVSEMGKGYIAGLADNGIIGCAKHFPGHGDTSTDSHTGFPLIDKSYDELNSCELVPFRAAAEAGADMVMTAHIQFPQIEKNTYTSVTTGEQVYLPATLSKTILTDILRDDIGFEGVVVTDAMEMAAVANNFDLYDSAELAINAGVDLILMPVDPSSYEGIAKLEKYIDVIEEKVESGAISEQRINESAERIIDLKLKRNLWDWERDVEKKVADALATVGSFEHHKKELEISNKAITLLENKDNTLPVPLEENDKVLFFYVNMNADNSFRYAFDCLKKEGLIPESAVAECIDYRADVDHSAAEYADKIKEAKAVIIASDNWGENEFDPATQSGIESKFNDELTALTHSFGKKIIVISIMYPYDAARFTDADAFLLAYGRKMMPVIPTEYNGELKTYGPNLISAILTVFGGNTPTGKLPVDVYEIDEKYQYTDKILYRLGSGLDGFGNSEPSPSPEPEPDKPSSEPFSYSGNSAYDGIHRDTLGSITVKLPEGGSSPSGAGSSDSSSSPAPVTAPAPAADESSNENPDTGRAVPGILAAAALAAAVVLSKKRNSGE